MTSFGESFADETSPLHVPHAYYMSHLIRMLHGQLSLERLHLRQGHMLR